MSLADWHEHEQRRLISEWVAVQAAGRRHRERRDRRRARLRRCAHWCNPLVQIVSDVGRQP